MNDQTRRAADFERRLRWPRLRQELRAADPADRGPAEEVVVDIRPSVERSEPPRED